jgi:hypothetical protein
MLLESRDRSKLPRYVPPLSGTETVVLTVKKLNVGS